MAPEKALLNKRSFFVENAVQKTTLERLMARVEKDVNDCWLWSGGLRGSMSYGSISVKGKLEMAHRAMYRETYGEIPKGICVLHKCDTPRCINPAHLFLGTNADNVADMMAKGRQAKGQAKVTNRKLSVDDVLEIRRLSSLGARRFDMAKRYSTHVSNIDAIVKRITWRYI